MNETNDPPEPDCPPDRKPHKQRVHDIDAMMMEGQTVGIAIDDTPVHRKWYLHEINKYPRLTVTYQGVLSKGVYIIKIKAGPSIRKGAS